jgi:hypothetical protein
VFKEPLGQAREVKTALSGLFGRFVVRVYMERYLGISSSPTWVDAKSSSMGSLASE